MTPKRCGIPLSLLLLVAGGALVVGAADETTPQDDPAGQPVGATVLEAPLEPVEQEDTLPEFDQDEIIRTQRKRLGKIKHELQLVMVTSESEHFMLFSDLDSRVRNAILIWLEDLRSKVITHLGVGPEERLWDGKCLAVVFARQEFLATFARRFDDHHVRRPRGYFVLEARRRKDPRLVHIAAYQPLKGGNQALREVLVHETTHAIVELYRKSAPLPLWVHEGLAEYMTLLVDPTLRPTKQAGAFKAATAMPYESIADLFTRDFPASDLTAYSVSMALVECLHRMQPGGVMRFVELLKEGKAPEEALALAYSGLTYDDLERRWRRFVMRHYRPAVDDNRDR